MLCTESGNKKRHESPLMTGITATRFVNRKVDLACRKLSSDIRKLYLREELCSNIGNVCLRNNRGDPIKILIANIGREIKGVFVQTNKAIVMKRLVRYELSVYKRSLTRRDKEGMR